MRVYNKFASRELLVRRLVSYIQKKVVERALTLDLAAEPRDFTDALSGPRSAGRKDTHFRYALHSGRLFDLFAAGTDTNAVTLSWACLLLATHPHGKFQVRKEVLEVSGSDRLVALQERHQRNYTLPVLDEVAQLASIALTSLIQRTEKSITLKSYFIPANIHPYSLTFMVFTLMPRFGRTH